MGNQFRSWADVYFSADGTNVNRELNKQETFKEFVSESGVKNWTTHAFTKAMKAFCKNAEWIHEQQPRELCNQTNRITRNINQKTTEMMYVRTVDEHGEPAKLNRDGLTF